MKTTYLIIIGLLALSILASGCTSRGYDVERSYDNFAGYAMATLFDKEECDGQDCESVFCSENADCDDGDINTLDVCSKATHTCSSTQITFCIDDDGACPEDCDLASDNDC